jgi:hypothetical protein
MQYGGGGDWPRDDPFTGGGEEGEEEERRRGGRRRRRRHGEGPQRIARAKGAVPGSLDSE